MEDDEYVFTEKGLYFAMECHQKLLDGWTLKSIAAFYGYEVELIQVVLYAFYEAADANGVPLGIDVPNTIEGLNG